MFRKMVYQLENTFKSPITYLSQSPVVDVVAIGCLDGTIIIQNIKTDTTIMKLSQNGKVTSIAFRTDEHEFMATTNVNGTITIWDLANKRMFHEMVSAHDGAISSCFFLNGQPILLTIGADNSVKVIYFLK